MFRFLICICTCRERERVQECDHRQHTQDIHTCTCYPSPFPHPLLHSYTLKHAQCICTHIPTYPHTRIPSPPSHVHVNTNVFVQEMFSYIPSARGNLPEGPKRPGLAAVDDTGAKSTKSMRRKKEAPKTRVSKDVSVLGFLFKQTCPCVQQSQLYL